MKKSIDYQEYLINSLKNPQEASNYLNAALEGGDIKVFLLALSNVAKAQGGVSKLATKAHKSRTSLYKTLSIEGNPYLKNTNEILSVMGMHFVIQPNNKNIDHL
ncbi:MAG: transcriptional regulator [Pseudomonadota bacterium]